MLKSIFHRQIRKMEARYGYDASHVHEILDISTAAFLKFAMFQFMSMDRKSVPKDAWYAACLAGALGEDCGPCAQLVVDMAVGDGVPAKTIAALLRGDVNITDASLGFRYEVAVASRNPEIATLVDEVTKRFSKRGLVSLDFSVTSSRVYPCLKRGMGHGIASVKLKVASETIPVKQAA